MVDLLHTVHIFGFRIISLCMLACHFPINSSDSSGNYSFSFIDFTHLVIDCIICFSWKRWRYTWILFYYRFYCLGCYKSFYSFWRNYLNSYGFVLFFLMLINLNFKLLIFFYFIFQKLFIHYYY